VEEEKEISRPETVGAHKWRPFYFLAQAGMPDFPSTLTSHKIEVKEV
jgi:hypothetical protein